MNGDDFDPHELDGPGMDDILATWAQIIQELRGSRVCLYAGPQGDTFNTPFNASLAYLAHVETKIILLREGEELVIRLEAPLNFDYGKVESGKGWVTSSSGDAESVVVTEESPNSRYLTGRIRLQSVATVKVGDGALQAAPGAKVEAGYGYGHWGRRVTFAL
jgi:hypothetical protein